MKAFFVLLLLALATPALADKMDGFKGYVAINNTLKDRVTGVTGFEIGQYVKEANPDPPGNGLTALLGTYQGTGAKFHNGLPNSANMLIWAVLLGRFADDIGADCAHPETLALRPEFVEVLTPLCRWPSALATSPVALKPYWQALMGYDAPDDEYAAWQDFADQEARAGHPAAVAIARLTAAALLNPYFLLKD